MTNEPENKKVLLQDTTPFNSTHEPTDYTAYHSRILNRDMTSVEQLDQEVAREEAAELRREARRTAREARRGNEDT